MDFRGAGGDRLYAGRDGAGETERASTEVDDLRSYYLAVGALQRAELELPWSVAFPDERRIPRGSTFVDYQFPSGVAHVEIIPEAARLDVNSVPVETFNRLLVALGVDVARSQQIAAAIDEWRRPAENGSEFDGYYESQVPSFRAPHASLQEIEELLLVKGITPEIFYGTYVPAAETEAGAATGPRLVPRGGLMDCLSVYGAKDRVDANTAHPAVLAALGVSPYVISAAGGAAPDVAHEPAATVGIHRIRGRVHGPPAGGRQLDRDDARDGAPVPAGWTPFGPEADGGGAGQVHAAGVRIRGLHAALVRHRLEPLTRMPRPLSITKDLRKLLAFGSGLGIEIGAEALEVAVTRVRPNRVQVLGRRTLAGYASRPAAEWGAEYTRFLNELGVGHLSATVLLPRREVIVRLVSLPGVASKDMEGALRLQLDALHPYGEDEVVWGWSPLAWGAVLVGIARRDTVERYHQLFTEAGIAVSAFTFRRRQCTPRCG